MQIFQLPEHLCLACRNRHFQYASSRDDKPTSIVPLSVWHLRLWYRYHHHSKQYINNMAGWCEWIQVDNQRVMSRCQMSREATLVENRNKLIDAGLIEFQRGKKGSPNKYKICTFKSVVKSVGETEAESVVQTEGKSVGETVAIYKHKRKLNNIAPARVNNKFNNFNQRPKHSDEFYNSVLDN